KERFGARLTEHIVLSDLLCVAFESREVRGAAKRNLVRQISRSTGRLEFDRQEESTRRHNPCNLHALRDRLARRTLRRIVAVTDVVNPERLARRIGWTIQEVPIQ